MSKSKKSASLPSSESNIFLTAKQLKDVLANKSAADSWHDFHTPISGIKGIIEENQAQYIAGLPTGVSSLGSFADEGAALSSVVTCPDPSCDYSDYLLGKCKGQKEIPGLTAPYQITTINGTQYSVKSMKVASGSKRTGNKEYVEAKEFIDALDIKDNSAIVIDAAAVSILDILKSGDAGRNPITIYYAYVPEVVNDPAGKTPIDSAVFRASGGINLLPCISNESPSLNYNYLFDTKFSGENMKNRLSDNYKKFFTKYNFQLSELQVNQKGKKIDYTTNLVISSSESGNKNSETITDSKKKNNITFLKAILINTIKLLVKTKPSDENKNIFLFNTKFQQKRSGDWLQVLACLLIKSRKLKYIPQKGPTIQNIEKQISDVYFVTHDRIALAFALLCGVECIYTHAQTKSVYIFKEASPEAVAAREAEILALKQARVENIYQNIGISGPDSATLAGEYRVNYINYENSVKKYTAFRNNIITTYTSQIKELKIDPKYSSLFSEGSDFNVDIFSEFTGNLFSLCFLQKFLLLHFPDIQKLYDEISPLADEIRNLKDGDTNRIIDLYENLMTKVNSCAETINKYINQDTSAEGNSIMINFDGTIATIKKSASYKLANGWSWSNTIGNSRVWDAFKKIIGDTSYKSDKNSFLYELDALSNEIKIYLTQTYGKILNRLDSISNDILKENIRNIANPINPGRGEKFIVVAKGFCAEVFLNFGYPIAQPEPEVITEKDREPPSPPSSEISPMPPAPPLDEELISTDLITTNTKIQSIPDIDMKITEIMSISSDYNLLRDEVITSENSAYTIGLNILTRTAARYLNSIISSIIPSAYVENERKLDSEATTINSEADEGAVEGTDIVSGGAVQTRSQTAKALSGLVNNDSGYIITSNFENNIKDATYVLLNALIDYKNNTSVLGMLNEIDTEPPMAGGSPLFNEDLEKMAALNELAQQLQIKPSSQSINDLLKDGVQFFHPMIPIYMIAEALNEVAADDNIDESLDYKIYINYLDYLIKMRDILRESYDSRRRIDIAVAFIIGQGLKELLISGNIYDMDYEMRGGENQNQKFSIPTQSSVFEFSPAEKQGVQTLDKLQDLGKGAEDANSYCEKVIGMTKSEFLPIAILNDSLRNYISGSKSKTIDEDEDAKKILNSKIFINYIKNINIPSLFDIDKNSIESIESFQKRCFAFLIETGNIIITDRGGNALNIPSVPPEEAELTQETPVKEKDLGLGLGLDTPMKIDNNSGAGAGGSLKQKARKNKQTIKHQQKIKGKVTRFYRDKIKKYTRKHRNKKHQP